MWGQQLISITNFTASGWLLFPAIKTRYHKTQLEGLSPEIYQHGRTGIVNSLWPGDTIWHQVPRLTLVQVIDYGYLQFKWHSVESSSMVDLQWNIWHWGSKWNLDTVCWDVVGCEWGAQALFTLGLFMFALSLVNFLSLLWSPSTNIEIFLFLLKVSFEGHIQNLQKNSCWFEIRMGFVGPILIKLGTSSIWGFL